MPTTPATQEIDDVELVRCVACGCVVVEGMEHRCHTAGPAVEIDPDLDWTIHARLFLLGLDPDTVDADSLRLGNGLGPSAAIIEVLVGYLGGRPA